MPFYSVEHSYPLTATQKSQIAAAITQLHTAKFLAPSMFVHIKFTASNASDQNYFLGGKPQCDSTNRIMASVRTSSSRTKEHFEELAEDIEKAWYNAVSGPVIEDGKDKGKRKDAVNDSQGVTIAKQLRVVAFTGLVAATENGNRVPSAGEEAAWLKKNAEEFQRRADAGDELYKDLLEEVNTREDLKQAYGT